MFGLLSGLLVLAFIVSIILVVIGRLTLEIFLKVILPIFVGLIILRILFAGLMLLFNPHFWIFVALVVLAIWLLSKVRGRK